MRISIEFGSYNNRRYSKPWIARITAWPVGGKPELEWGGYVGDDSGGEVEIEAQPGDIIRAGQKDGRGGNSKNRWYVVEPDGSTREIDQTEARALWSLREAKGAAELESATPTGIVLDAITDVGGNPLAVFSSEQLQAELARRGAVVS